MIKDQMTEGRCYGRKKEMLMVESGWRFDREKIFVVESRDREMEAKL